MNTKTPSPKTEPIPQIISYLTIRRAVGILGIVLPVVLVVGSVVCGGCDSIQVSISKYYHTNMRDVFVGILCAVALFMYAYKGYKNSADNIAGNLACIFALGVAMFPTSLPGQTTCINITHNASIVNYFHFISATLFFLTLAYFSIFLFTKTDKSKEELKEHYPNKLKRNSIYRICGYVIIGSIILIALYLQVLKEYFPKMESYNPIFWLEALALWAFGISWLTKGKTIWVDIKNDDSNANN